MRKSALVIVLVLSAFVLSQAAFAAEKAQKPEPKAPTVKESVKKDLETVTGTVAAKKNDRGQVTDIELAAGGTTYHVAMNADGKALAADDGKQVEVTGTVTGSGEKKWFHVKSYKVVPAAPEAAK